MGWCVGMIHSFCYSAAKVVIECCAWVRARIGASIRALGDFFAEDRCLLCKKQGNGFGKNKPGGGEDAGPDGTRGQEALVRPVSIRFLGTRFENHPICLPCAGAFQPARNIGLLGSIESIGVTTIAGDRFGADPPLERIDCSPLAIEPAPVGIVAPWMTDDNVLQVVHLVKYKSVTSLIEVLARSIAAAIDRFHLQIPERSVLVPVPLYEAEKRNVNHTSLLADSLARLLSLPTDSVRLRKIRVTERQSRTPRQLRAQNVRNAFIAAGFGQTHVFLVDDVVTSGATAGACCAALAAGKAASITILCFGRAL
jgi:predicted amidophosphoribosyltransferase